MTKRKTNTITVRGGADMTIRRAPTVDRTLRLPRELVDKINAWAEATARPGLRRSTNRAIVALLWEAIDTWEAAQEAEAQAADHRAVARYREGARSAQTWPVCVSPNCGDAAVEGSDRCPSCIAAR